MLGLFTNEVLKGYKKKNTETERSKVNGKICTSEEV